jgi:hypothetical protein
MPPNKTTRNALFGIFILLNFQIPSENDQLIKLPFALGWTNVLRVLYGKGNARGRF